MRATFLSQEKHLYQPVGFGIDGGVQMAAPSRAYACSCFAAYTAMEALEGADVVFSGAVVGVTDIQDGDAFMAPTSREYLFDVKAVWKGAAQGQFRIRTGFGGGDCGVSFDLGETRVVFAYMGEDKVLGTGLCSYVRMPGDPPDEVALSRDTGIIWSPEAAVSIDDQQPEQPGVSIFSIVPLAGVVALAVAGGMGIWNRRRPAR